MPLPKIATPTYELVLPSNKKTIKYRPFLVKEEKLLVLAIESEDTKQITTAVKKKILSLHDNQFYADHGKNMFFLVWIHIRHRKKIR